MIPFSRLLMYGNVVQDYLLNIDFSTATVGSTDVVDSSENGFIFSKLNTGSAVVTYDDNIKENVMSFGGAIFSTPMNAVLDFSSFDVEIDFMYRCTAGFSTIQVIWGTGYYPDAANVMPGICHQIHQYSGQSQTFVTKSTAEYWRNAMVGETDDTWHRIVIRKVGTTISAIRYNMAGTAVSDFTGTGQSFGVTQALGIGGYYKGLSSAFYGNIRHLRIKRI